MWDKVWATSLLRIKTISWRFCGGIDFLKHLINILFEIRSEPLRMAGGTFQQSLSKNGQTAPRTGQGYPHKGPFVATAFWSSQQVGVWRQCGETARFGFVSGLTLFVTYDLRHFAGRVATVSAWGAVGGLDIIGKEFKFETFWQWSLQHMIFMICMSDSKAFVQ